METNARYILVGLFTLVAIVTGFIFTYWLNNNGTAGQLEQYEVHFLGPVSGLQNGAVVQFNGIRVGEVMGLRFDSNNQVVATISVAKGLVIRSDTSVSVDFQGLMGTALISLKGGAPKAPRLVPDARALPVLEADVSAGQDLTQTARGTLNRIDKILADNADPIKDTIGSLKTFSAALARNSNRVDTILAGLEKMTGGSPAERPKPVYDLAINTSAIQQIHTPNQYLVPEPTAVLALDTQRMLTRATDGQIAQFGDAEWSDNIPKLIQAKLVQALSDAGIAAQASTPDQAESGTQISIDLANFSLSPGANPTAQIDFSAKLISPAGKILATRTFHAEALASGGDVAATVFAFDKAFGDILASLLPWISAQH